MVEARRKRNEVVRELIENAAKRGGDVATDMAIDHVAGDALVAGAQGLAEAALGEGLGAAAFGGAVGWLPGAIAGFILGKIARGAYNYLTEEDPINLEEALPGDYIVYGYENNKNNWHYVEITLEDED